MEDMDFGRISIDETTTTSSDMSTKKSIDAAHQTSIDDTPPEAGKFSLTYNANKGVVLGEPKGQLSNSINSIMNEQGTEIPVKINSISKRDHEIKFPLQDYLNPGRTYSNRSAIKLPKGDTKKSGVSLEYLILVRQNPFRGTVSEHPHDHIEYLEDMMDDEYNRYPIPNPDSFTQSYDAAVLSRQGKAKFRLNQAFTGNLKMATDLNGKIDIIYSELMRKFDAFCEHIMKLDVNVVLLKSGKHLIQSTIEINNAEKRADIEKTAENRSRPIILDSPNPESETPREKEQSITEEVAIDLEEEEEEFEEDVEIDRQEGTNVDRPTTLAEESFINLCSDDPLEKLLTSSDEETIII
ncbi:hypothetical protein F2Q68_00006738 [Brassica cretica]|uniref:Uncharacterized protein n=1 Tax=Brassica cretica TaxID=69181 RepID=A0A8S9J5Y8_BRACR|nr:hypothetical protein F2Q68_00006738 [Brassica cretica]